MKAITVKYAGVCAGCGRRIPKGATALWDETSRGKVWHSDIDCAAKAARGERPSQDRHDMDMEDDGARACGLL